MKSVVVFNFRPPNKSYFGVLIVTIVCFYFEQI